MEAALERPRQPTPMRRARRTRRPLQRLHLHLHWCSLLYFEVLVVGRWHVAKLDWGPDLAQDGPAEMRPTILGSSTLGANAFRLFSACKMIAAWCDAASMRKAMQWHEGPISCDQVDSYRGCKLMPCSLCSSTRTLWRARTLPSSFTMTVSRSLQQM